jgi:hypothetical protein
MERCIHEIAAIEAEILAGNPDLQEDANAASVADRRTAARR